MFGQHTASVGNITYYLRMIRIDTWFFRGVAQPPTTTNGDKLSPGVDLRAPDTSGKTALHNAAAGGHRDAVPGQTL